MAKISNLEKLVDKSEFIFEASVQKIGEATHPLVPVTKETAIVKVRQTLRLPPGLGDFSGQAITVQFYGKPTPLKKQSLLIFASGWLYGTSIVLKEYAHARASPSLQLQVIETEQKLQERTLRERVRQASVIVTGRIKEVQPLHHRKETPKQVESKWSEVLLEISSWEKPFKKEKPIRVVCPLRPIRRFPRVRMFRQGQEGIFMLRPISIKGVQGRAYFAEDTDDFQPLGRLDLIRKLIRGA